MKKTLSICLQEQGDTHYILQESVQISIPSVWESIAQMVSDKGIMITPLYSQVFKNDHVNETKEQWLDISLFPDARPPNAPCEIYNRDMTISCESNMYSQMI